MILSLNQPDFIAVNFYVWIVMFRSEFVPRRKYSLLFIVKTNYDQLLAAI